MAKCDLCKCYIEDDVCPCHYNPNDELCEYGFDLVDITVHDKTLRTEMIIKIEKLLIDRFTCDDLRTDWTNADIRETIHFELEQLKEN